MRAQPILLLALGFGLLVCAEQATATVPANGWSIQAFGGVPLNLPSRLTVTQQGYDELSHEASWRTRPLELPVYWMMRVCRQRTQTAWELQFLHHKLYLRNNPPEIAHLEVTHGFNIATINRVYRRAGSDVRLGAGLILPRTESNIRGNRHDSNGYDFTGLALLVGAGRQHSFTSRLFGIAECQFTAAWADVDVADGQARIRSFAFHFLLGAGCRL